MSDNNVQINVIGDFTQFNQQTQQALQGLSDKAKDKQKKIASDLYVTWVAAAQIGNVLARQGQDITNVKLAQAGIDIIQTGVTIKLLAARATAYFSEGRLAPALAISALIPVLVQAELQQKILQLEQMKLQNRWHKMTNTMVLNI